MPSDEIVNKTVDNLNIDLFDNIFSYFRCLLPNTNAGVGPRTKVFWVM